jgi:hypothetical protein
MDPTKMSTQEVMMYAALFNAGIGLVAGLVPLILGFVKGKVKYGVIGFLACLVGGALLGVILSIPAMIVFTWLIIRGAKLTSTDAGPTSGTEN